MHAASAKCAKALVQRAIHIFSSVKFAANVSLHTHFSLTYAWIKLAQTGMVCLWNQIWCRRSAGTFPNQSMTVLGICPVSNPQPSLNSNRSTDECEAFWLDKIFQGTSMKRFYWTKFILNYFNWSRVSWEWNRLYPGCIWRECDKLVRWRLPHLLLSLWLHVCSRPQTQASTECVIFGKA